MTAEDNKNLVKSWIANANSGFTQGFAKFISADFVGHSSRGEIDFYQLQELELAFAKAFPDVSYVIEDLIAEQDKVVLRVTTVGTHRQDFYGFPATHRSVRFSGIVIYRIQDSKISECWDGIDFSGLWQQLTRSHVED